MRPIEQRPGLGVAFQRRPAAKHQKETGYDRSSWKQERSDGRSGSLSRLIVALESRGTHLGRSL